MKKLIVLIGPMGVGKSTIAPVIASMLDCQVYDTDDLVEEAIPCTGGEYIQNFGIDAFRRVEEKVILNRADDLQGVLATGGGAWTLKKVRDILIPISVTFYLTATDQTLADRLRYTNKVLVKNKNPIDVAREQISSRHMAYSISDYAIITDGRTVTEIASTIVDYIGGLNIQVRQ